MVSIGGPEVAAPRNAFSGSATQGFFREIRAFPETQAPAEERKSLPELTVFRPSQKKQLLGEQLVIQSFHTNV